MCIPQNRPCHVINRLWPEKDKRPVACKWFLNAVLPLDKGLEKLVQIMQKESDDPVKHVYSHCAVCGKIFNPTSNRQRYCPTCGKENERRKACARRRRTYLKTQV